MQAHFYRTAVFASVALWVSIVCMSVFKITYGDEFAKALFRETINGTYTLKFTEHLWDVFPEAKTVYSGIINAS